MKILVIIAAYNAERFIASTIKSILKQSYKNIQIIVVDDCSTDNTAKIVESLNVKLIRCNKNIGKFNALNIALHQAKNFDAFYIHDADDISYQEHFTELVTPMILNKNILLSYCNYRRINYTSGEMSQPIIGQKCSMALYSAKVFKKIGYFDDTRFGGDTEYWMRFLLYFKPENIFHVNKVLANCSVHGNNLTSIYDLRKRQQYTQKFKFKHRNIEKYNYHKFINPLTL